MSKSLQLAAINFNYNPATDASDKTFDLSDASAAVQATCTACHVYADLTLHVEVQVRLSQAHRACAAHVRTWVSPAPLS